MFLANQPCTHENCGCVLREPPEKCGLLWIGQVYYKNPSDWTNEARLLGVSRRISTVPKGFEVGKTLVLVAHQNFSEKACECTVGVVDATPDPKCGKCHGTGKVNLAAVFHAFTPTRIEYVLKGTETEEELDRLEKRGLTLVKLQ